MIIQRPTHFVHLDIGLTQFKHRGVTVSIAIVRTGEVHVKETNCDCRSVLGFH